MADDVVKLVPRAEQEAAKRKANIDASRAEAYEMLEKAKGILDADPAALSIFVAIGFSDGAYGSIIPMQSMCCATVLAGIADGNYRYLAKLNEPHD